MSGHILVVDDDPDITEFLRTTLLQAGHTVEGAGDGAEALGRCEAVDFDVLLTDLHMPGLSGIQILRAARDLCPDMEVIPFTGQASMEDAIEALREGAFDFLLKPFDSPTLLRTVSRAIERRQLRTTKKLHEVSQIVFATVDPQRLPERIVSIATEALGADEASLMLPNEEGALHIAFAVGLPEEALRVDASGVAARVAAGCSPAIILGGVDDDPRFSDLERSSREIRSSIVYPLCSGERLLGVLNLNRVSQIRPFRQADLERASIFASHVVLALENSRLAARMLSNERLATIGLITAGVVHEINNPISFVLANLAEIRRGLVTVRALATRFETRESVADPSLPHAVGHEAREIVDDLLLAMADVDEGTARIRDLAKDIQGISVTDERAITFPLVDAVRSAARLSRPQVHPHAELVIRIDPRVRVSGNPGRIGQVFLNLLVNAAQAIAERPGPYGRITVTATETEVAVVVEVKDTGPGIAPERLRRMFEPFFTTKPAGKGTGLGLSISREIVRRYGGDLAVSSPPGEEGANFRVTLRSAAPATEATPLPTPNLKRADPHRPRVLFVDDELMLLRSYEREFRGDFETSFASGGREALSLVTSRAFDVVVCDLVMPGPSGIALYREACRLCPALSGRFLVVTGSPGHAEIEQIEETLGTKTLLKPIDFVELRKRILARGPPRHA